MQHPIIIAFAGMLAGAMNAAAGGGSFVSFPALVFAGVPAATANMTSTVALAPAAFASALAYREDFRPFGEVSLKVLFFVSLVVGWLVSGRMLRPIGQITATVRRIQAKVSEAIARFQFEKTERHDALDSARTRWLSAVDLAILKDQFDAERLHATARSLLQHPPVPPDTIPYSLRAMQDATLAVYAELTDERH